MAQGRPALAKITVSDFSRSARKRAIRGVGVPALRGGGLELADGRVEGVERFAAQFHRPTLVEDDLLGDGHVDLYRRGGKSLTPVLRRDSTTGHDGPQRALRQNLPSVLGEDDLLSRLCIPPFLMTSRLADHEKAMAFQNRSRSSRSDSRRSLAHPTVTSASLASFGSSISDGAR